MVALVWRDQRSKFVEETTSSRQVLKWHSFSFHYACFELMNVGGSIRIHQAISEATPVIDVDGPYLYRKYTRNLLRLVCMWHL